MTVGSASPAGNEGFGSLRHLAGRLAGSLRPGGPGPAEDDWARGWLGPGERQLWQAMSGADRRHAVEVAHRAALALTGDADGAGTATPVLAAALLHDVGKIESRLGTWGRVAVTITAMLLGRHRVAGWSDRSHGWRGRAGRYLRHDQLGAAMLREAGAAALTISWAGEHHLPPSRWSVDDRLGAALKAADGD